MDFDEIQNVIVNAHLTERLHGEGNNYRWKLLPFEHPQIQSLYKEYEKVGDSEWKDSFLNQACAVFMFSHFLHSKNNHVMFHFYTALKIFEKAPENDKSRVIFQIQEKFFKNYGSLTIGTSNTALLGRKRTADNSIRLGSSKSQASEKEEEEDKSEASSDRSKYLGLPSEDVEALEEFFNDHKHKMINEDVFKKILDKLQKKIWNDQYPQFVKTQNFIQFLQLKELASRKVSPKQFNKIRIVGKGAFGAVYAVEKLDTHRVYAWKEMDKRKLKFDKSFDVALNELRRLSEISSPFVTKLRYSLQTETSVVLVMDFYSGGDLKYHMKYSSPDRRKKPFSAQVAKFFAIEILLGLEAMHRKRIIYRDLKPANILLDATGHVHISDLGLAKKLSKDRPYSTGLSGTPGYWAPEVLCRNPYNVWADWWSYGVVLYELLCGKRPPCVCKKSTKQWCTFSDRKDSEENALSDDGIYTQELYFPIKYFSPEAEDLIRKLLTPKKSERLGFKSVDELKAHPYFANVDFEAYRCGKIPPPFIPKKKGVNAKPIAEVGDFDSHNYRRLKLSEDDEKFLSQFHYQEERVIQNELVDVLKVELRCGGKFTETEFQSGEFESESSITCCNVQ